MTIRFTFLLAALAIGMPPAFAESANLLGKVDFPNSGAPEAQADFIEGVLYLHNFEYEEANEAFKRARAIDPDFAMAYWGEAMTYHQSLWQKQARSAAVEVLRRLGRTPEERAAKAPTQREKDYLHAVETLFGMTDASRRGTKLEREILYRDAMQRIHETYPDDHEAAAFYGLSILGVGSNNRNYATYMRAAAELMEVWDANRKHPGAAHYLIHSFDDPVHAPLGLPMARAYAEIAPAAAHAQHMTSHIFSALGMWDDLVSANEVATKLEADILSGQGERSREASHYVYWLQYGYMQQGRFGEAKRLMKAARERLENNPMARERAYYGAMYARYLVDTGDWASATTWAAPEGVEIPAAHYHYARAVAAIKRGNLDAAHHRARYVVPEGEGNPEIVLSKAVVKVLHQEIAALSALHEGKTTIALDHARQAVEGERALPFQYGPPRIVIPAAELLGEVLLKLDRPEEAQAAFEDQLTRTPRRTNALLGLARAAKAAGDAHTATETYRELAEIWRAADPTLPAVQEARAAAQDS